MTENDEYERMAQHVTTKDGRSTDHLVVEERGAEVLTACGRTLSTVTVTGTGSYVFPIGAVPHGKKCGNCPWDEVDEEVEE